MHLQEASQSEQRAAEDSQRRATEATERAHGLEGRLQSMEATAALAQQQLAQHISTSQAEMAAASERVQLQAGLAEVNSSSLLPFPLGDWQACLVLPCQYSMQRTDAPMQELDLHDQTPIHA